MKIYKQKEFGFSECPQRTDSAFSTIKVLLFADMYLISSRSTGLAAQTLFTLKMSVINTKPRESQG